MIPYNAPQVHGSWSNIWSNYSTRNHQVAKREAKSLHFVFWKNDLLKNLLKGFEDLNDYDDLFHYVYPLTYSYSRLYTYIQVVPELLFLYGLTVLYLSCPECQAARIQMQAQDFGITGTDPDVTMLGLAPYGHSVAWLRDAATVFSLALLFIYTPTIGVSSIDVQGVKHFY